MLAWAPRSTWIHCGSEKVDDHRVVVSPSTAALAGVPAFSTDDAVAGLSWDSRVAAARAGGVDTVTASAPAIAATRATAAIGVRRRIFMAPPRVRLPTDGDLEPLRVAVRDERG